MNAHGALGLWGRHMPLYRRREHAKAKGVRRRPPKLTAHLEKEAIRLRDHGEETLAEIGRSYNGSGWTIARLTDGR